EIALVNLNTDSGLKTVTINAGSMSLEGGIGDGNLGDPTANLVINPGGLFYLWNLAPVFNKRVVLQGGTFQSLAGNNSAGGSVTIITDSMIDTTGNLTFTGAISGTAGITKTGAGVLNLN